LIITDHNLVRAWFNVGVQQEIRWKKPTYETIKWYKRDEDSLRKMEEKLESMLGQRSDFYNTMENIKIAQDKTLKKKRIRV